MGRQSTEESKALLSDVDVERGQDHQGPIVNEQPPKSTRRNVARSYIIKLTSVVCVAFLIFTIGSGFVKEHSKTPKLHLPVSMQRSWGAYSPWYPTEKYRKPPPGCKITQVNILQRHGARFPTSGSSLKIKAALAKLQSVDTFSDHRLKFLKKFEYQLGVGELVHFGAAQSYDSGLVDRTRYRKLVGKHSLPFVRASGSPRVIDSATNWTAGFAAAGHKTYKPKLSVIMSEEDGLNNTLHNYCPNIGTAKAQTDEWQSVYAPGIRARLNAVAIGANLTDEDVTSLISLCPFETVAYEKPSAFCDLFSQNEYEAYEYYHDLDKYYGTGYGQPLGPVEGVGYINELIARLTGEPVRDHTQTNTTLDSSPETFPYNRTIYADFSHDLQMVAIYSAIGLLKQLQPLDPMQPLGNRTWRASHIISFSARMITEKLACGNEGKEHVRILLNDQLQPLEFCGADKHGLCALEDFVESQRYARHDGDGDFERCFE